MPESPKHASPLPPLGRGHEGSRLAAQQVISAYELIVPVVRRRFELHQESFQIRTRLSDPAGMRNAIGGSCQ
jgi:hypothetical protein